MDRAHIVVRRKARGRKVQDALEGELQAILLALQHSWSLGHHQVIVESDCQKAIDLVNRKNMHFEYYNWIRDIISWSRKFQDIRFQWSSRNANRVADKLAKNIGAVDIFNYFYYAPLYLGDLLHWDHVHSV